MCPTPHAKNHKFVQMKKFYIDCLLMFSSSNYSRYMVHPRNVYLCVMYRVSEYIPSRPALPKRIGGAERAILDFHKEVGNIINLLLSEYRYVT